MTLQEEILNDLKDAMRSRDALKLSTLRMLSAAIKNKKIDLGKEPNDIEIGQIIIKEIKQRKDSIEQYEKGGRQELAQKEQSEIEILKKYMPEQMSEDEIKKIISETIQKVGATGPEDMGKVMGATMPNLQGKADGSLISKLVQESLRNL